MERNRIKIRYNPYKSENCFEYKRWAVGQDGKYEWMDLGDKSPLLLEDKYIHGKMQNNICDILDKIIEQFDSGNIGLDIVFEGTEDDFDELKDIIKDKEIYPNEDINCEKGDFYLDSAEDIMPTIIKIFTELADLFKQFETPEISSKINKFLDATKQVIPICVFGIHSTGKSAFINSLIGEEILPSASKATTARNYKIIPSDEETGKIKFANNKEDIQIIIEQNGKYKIDANIDKELRKDLKACLDKYINESLSKKIYYLLKTINDYANDPNKNKEDIGSLIEVQVPFYNGLLKKKNYNFAIFDTPGSDNATDAQHLDVLKEALEEQTNGLPILVSTLNTIEGNSTAILEDIKNKLANNLDLYNTMVIINQADILSKDDIEDYNIKGTSNRLYFMSSIIGLGSKKCIFTDGKNLECDWIDNTYRRTFKKYNEDFYNTTFEDYNELYQYNNISKHIKKRYKTEIENIKDKKELIYINSGLHCVETQIITYAEKSALYNKCLQAQNYLNLAIGATDILMDKKGKTLKEMKYSNCRKMDKHKQELMHTLCKKINMLTSQYGSEYTWYMYEKHMTTYPEQCKEDVKNKIDILWIKYKVGNRKQRVENFLNAFNLWFSEKSDNVKQKIFYDSKFFWDAKCKELKDKCCNIIKEDENLSKEESEYLQGFIMNCTVVLYFPNHDSISVNDISKHIINIFGFQVFKLNTINQRRTTSIYDQFLQDYITQISSRIKWHHIKAFNDFQKKLQNGIDDKIISFNPKLRKCNKKIHELGDEIKDLQVKKKKIEEAQSEINKLCEFKIELEKK